MRILMATTRSEALFHEFCEALRHEMENVDLLFARNWTGVLAAVRDMPPGFLILDQGLPEGKPLALSRKLLAVNAAVNCIVLTELDDAAFHEAAEGLGIFASLPMQPGFEDGAILARRMQRLVGERSRVQK